MHLQLFYDQQQPLKNGNVGGLLGIHCRQEEKLAKPVVSIDGTQLKEFGFINIEQVLRFTEAVPVVIKSHCSQNMRSVAVELERNVEFY